MGFVMMRIFSICLCLLVGLWVMSVSNLSSFAVGQEYIIPNGDFSRAGGKTGIPGWIAERGTALQHDAVEGFTAPGSLRMKVEEGEPAVIRSDSWSRMPERVFVVSGRTRTAGTIIRMQAVVQTLTGPPQWDTVDYQEFNLTPSEGWRTFRRTINPKAGATTGLLRLTVRGSGTLWLDDVRIILPQEELAPAPGDRELPGGWRPDDGAAAAISLAHDKTSFVVPPQSLHIQAIKAASVRSESLPRTGDLGGQSTLRFRYRKQGAGATFIVQGLAANFSGLQYLTHELPPSADWSEFTRTITWDPRTAHVVLRFQMKGEGDLWVDDMTYGDRPVTAQIAGGCVVLDLCWIRLRILNPSPTNPCPSTPPSRNVGKMCL